MARRYKSLHFNLKEDQNVVFHREHRSKKGRKMKKDSNFAFLKYKWKKKYGSDDIPYKI